MKFLLNLTLFSTLYFIKKFYSYGKTHSLKGIESVLKPPTTPKIPLKKSVF